MICLCLDPQGDPSSHSYIVKKGFSEAGRAGAGAEVRAVWREEKADGREEFPSRGSFSSPWRASERGSFIRPQWDIQTRKEPVRPRTTLNSFSL